MANIGRRTEINKYGMTLFLVATSTFLGWILHHSFNMHAPFVTFYPSVILASLLCGVGPALLATVLSGLIVKYILLEPIGSLKVEAFGDIVAMTVFAFNGILLTIVAHRLNMARIEQVRRESLQKAHDELERLVEERTAELRESYTKLEKEMAERKKSEERLRQAHKMEAIGTLAGGIAHDFNNILAGMIGFTELAMDDTLPESKTYRSLERVLRGGFRGRDLVKQILAFSRKTDYTREPLSLLPLISETVKLLQASLPAAVKIAVHATALSDTVLANPTEIQQVLMNLCTNAAHAMADTGGTLSITLSDADTLPGLIVEPGFVPYGYVQITVKDTGAGMDSEVIKKIFEPFFTTKAVGQGTGMGLAVVYGIVKDLNGEITVESEPGTGSTFRIYLPRIETDIRSDTVETKEISRGKERILFIDDEEAIAELGKAMLKRLGYEVTAVTNSTEALKFFSDNPSRFDLVITDQTMPTMSGLHLAEELLKIRSDLPIIICTGYSDTVSPEKAKEAGIREFLMKPLARREMAEAVRRVLDGKADEGS